MLLKSSIDFTKLRINIVGQFTTVFLLTVALLPAVSLYWDSTLFGVQTNWLIYPLLLLSAMVLVITSRSTSETGVYLVGAGIVYGLLCVAFGGDIQKLVRIVFSLLPIAFIRYAERIGLRQFKWFLGIYVALMLIPVYNCYLQLKGELPYYTFDTIDGVHLGRLSGGYNKPTGLIVFLFSSLPIWVLSMARKGKTLAGHFVVALIFVV
ncbi:MAG: hypothetical protein HC859_10005, partial [Bacteroidia bacterium]|nr:hypothetical protein [Bacteroidia bacterium]